MKPNFRKLEVRDLRDVERFITENVESLEAGLEIIDTCVLLGHARVDLVGLDSRGSLVMITLGFSGNDEMLLRMLDAYSWCLDYPDTLRRLYPRARIHPGTSSRVRVMFVAESLPDEFLRKVKHFAFPEVACFKFLHFEINGETAVYFDLVERIQHAFTDPAAPEVENEADEPDRPEVLPVQHACIEGTPPVAPVPVAGANGRSAAAAEPRTPDWQGFLRQLGQAEGGTETERLDAPAAAPPVGDWHDFLSGLTSAAAAEVEREWPGDADPAVEPADVARPDTEETGPLPGLGAGDPPPADDGALSREWREFLNHLKASG